MDRTPVARPTTGTRLRRTHGPDPRNTTTGRVLAVIDDKHLGYVVVMKFWQPHRRRHQVRIAHRVQWERGWDDDAGTIEVLISARATG